MTQRSLEECYARLKEDFAFWKSPFRDIGVNVFISSADTKHYMPHIHCYYSGEECVVSLLDFEILKGSINKAKLKLIFEILQTHRDLANFLIVLFYKRNPQLLKKLKHDGRINEICSTTENSMDNIE